jgi:UDP-N-acetylmuramyl pentapeptide phosphotransferase/UDP-N-acetylglucosamine-1-phosphate transferase
MFLTHIFEIIFCGFVLWALNLLSGINESILFAGSTYTAMGFMDDILPIGWKMLAVTIAFSGMFTFAWTASAMVSMTKNFRQAFTKQHMHHLKLPAELIERFK